jgi:inosose dehydratase
MNLQIGTAPCSWGVEFPEDDGQVPWKRCLREIAEAGYEWTELGPYGYIPSDPDALREVLAEQGLRVCSAFVMRPFEDPGSWGAIEEEVRRAAELLAAVEAPHIVLIDDTYFDRQNGEQLSPADLDDADFARLIEGVERTASIVRDEFGVQAVFHPHAETHVHSEAQIEEYLRLADLDVAPLAFDTGHHAYCGGDPVAFFRKHHQHIRYLHLKSIDGAILEKARADGVDFMETVLRKVFVEPAVGTVDFEGFREALEEVDFQGFAVVEQDMYPVASLDDPLPIAARTREWLREQGWG